MDTQPGRIFGREPAMVLAGSSPVSGATPHFKDVKGFQNNFQFTGEDPVALRDVVGIVLEVPNEAIAARPSIRLWARTVRPVHGVLTVIDQAGLPGTNNTFR